jgi:hypothetical protein
MTVYLLGSIQPHTQKVGFDVPIVVKEYDPSAYFNYIDGQMAESKRHGSAKNCLFEFIDPDYIGGYSDSFTKLVVAIVKHYIGLDYPVAVGESRTGHTFLIQIGLHQKAKE